MSSLGWEAEPEDVGFKFLEVCEWGRPNPRLKEDRSGTRRRTAPTFFRHARIHTSYETCFVSK